MSRRRTFAFRGHIVSVVPDSQILAVRDREEATRVMRSAEREGGAALLFDILGKWAPARRIRRSKLRNLVVDEIEKHSLLLRRPLREAIAYRLPDPVNLRDLIEPAPLGGDTTEPSPLDTQEPPPWIEFELFDSHGRPLDHFSCALRSSTDEATFDLVGSKVHREALSSSASVNLLVTAKPRVASDG